VKYGVSPLDYAKRARSLSKLGDHASLVYASLELRCGIESRLQQHASVAVGVSKGQASAWEITKLGRTLETAFGLGDAMLVVLLNMADGRTCQFVYVPVSARLREIGKRCGDYLHSLKPERAYVEEFWAELRSLVTEGCGLLEMACSSEILRPTIESGFHFHLAPEDPRTSVINDLIAGSPGHFSVVTITPTGPMTYIPGDDA
jgi:hypothetical protein